MEEEEEEKRKGGRVGLVEVMEGGRSRTSRAEGQGTSVGGEVTDTCERGECGRREEMMVRGWGEMGPGMSHKRGVRGGQGRIGKREE